MVGLADGGQFRSGPLWSFPRNRRLHEADDTSRHRVGQIVPRLDRGPPSAHRDQSATGSASPEGNAWHGLSVLWEEQKSPDMHLTAFCEENDASCQSMVPADKSPEKADAAGIEAAAPALRSPDSSRIQQLCENCRRVLTNIQPKPDDPDLRVVVEAWPVLPEAIKQGILAMVRSTGEMD